MIIINASTSVKTLMADNGKNFTVLPGSVSEPFLATKQLIMAAIQMGTPREIGIVTGGSYEFEIAKTILQAAPYLYVDLDEAKAKLIDPEKDYTVKRSSSADLLVKQQLIERTKELNEATQKIAELEGKLKEADSNELVSKLNVIISEKTQQAETLSKRIQELENQLTRANENESSLRLEITELKGKANQATTALESLRKDYANEVAQKEQYKRDLESLPSNQQISELQDKVLELTQGITARDNHIVELNNQIKSMPSAEAIASNQDEISKMTELVNEKDSEISKLREGLGNALNDIENMKNTFNDILKKFRIVKDANNEFIQLPEQ